MYNVTEELKAGGTDDVCEWWLISRPTSVDLFNRNAALQEMRNIAYATDASRLLASCWEGTIFISCSTENDRKDEDSIES